MTPTDLRLFFLTMVELPDRTLHCCKTVAPSIEDATAQAIAYYGPSELNAWASRMINTNARVFGGGTFIPSPHDALLSSQELAAVSH